MEKKNTLLLTVIAIATLLVAVVGATFAYFSADQNVANAVLNASVNTTSAGTSSFIASSSGTDLDITTDAVNMDATANSTTDAKYTKNGTITVDLTGIEGSTMTCDYKIQWSWDSSATYSPTSTLSGNKELTVTVTKNTTSSSNSGADESGTNSGEHEFAAASATAVTLVSDAKLVSNNGATVKAVWDVSFKFYNAPTNQDALKSQIIKGKVEVVAGTCKATTYTA